MRIIIKIAQPTIFALLLMGCAHSVVSDELPIETSSTQSQTPALWHDGSKGGLYGIGGGWSIEIKDPEYETVIETIVSYPKSELISVPAVIKWVKDDSEDLSGDPIMVSGLITTPAEYEIVTETIVVKPEKTEYYLADATYNSDGNIKTPKTVIRQLIPAITKEINRRVMKVPPRTVQGMVPLERRKGYRRVVKIPARTMEAKPPPPAKPESRRVEAQPLQFLIRNPDGDVAHVFIEFEGLTGFIDSLN